MTRAPLLLLVFVPALLVGCAGSAPTPGRPGDVGPAAVLEVVNAEAGPITALFASACSDSGWGGNRLSGGPLRPGAQTTVSLPPGCWDVKAQTAGGEEHVRRGVQLRPGTTFTWRVDD